MATYTLSNVAIPSTIAEDLTTVELDITVTDASTWPTADFLVRIDLEVIDIQSRAGNVLTVRSGGRGVGDTVAATHSDGDIIEHVLDVNDLPFRRTVGSVQWEAQGDIDLDGNYLIGHNEYLYNLGDIDLTGMTDGDHLSVTIGTMTEEVITPTPTAVPSSGTPSNALDGNTSTYWSALCSSGVMGINFDFGEPVTLSRIRIRYGASYGAPFAIRTSTDGSTWSDLIVFGNTHVSNSWVNHDFPETSSRYWRLEERTTSGSYWRLYEVDFWNAQAIWSPVSMSDYLDDYLPIDGTGTMTGDLLMGTYLVYAGGLIIDGAGDDEWHVSQGGNQFQISFHDDSAATTRSVFNANGVGLSNDGDWWFSNLVDGSTVLQFDESADTLTSYVDLYLTEIVAASTGPMYLTVGAQHTIEMLTDGDIKFLSTAGSTTLLWDESDSRWEFSTDVDLNSNGLSSVSDVASWDNNLWLVAKNSGAAAQSIYLAADNTSGVQTTRILIDGGGGTTLYDSAGDAAISITTTGIGLNNYGLSQLPWVTTGTSDEFKFYSNLSVLRWTLDTSDGTVTQTGQLIVPNGTASAPGVRLTSEAHGLYRFDASNVALAANGGAALIASTGGVTVMGDYLYFNGTTGSEYWQFSDASNWARIVLDGGERFRVNTSGQALTGNGSQTLPGWTFIGEPGLGAFRATTNQGALVVNGDRVMFWQPAGVNQGSGTRGKGALWVYSNDTSGLGGTSGNNLILQSWHGSDSNQAELRLELLRVNTGTSWTSSAWGFRRITDSTAQASLWFFGNFIGVGTSAPGSELDVNGQIYSNPSSIGGSTAYLYSRGSGKYELALASSSIRHKTDLTKFEANPIGAFRFYNEHSEAWEFGLVAEHVQEAMGDDAVVFEDDGKVRDYRDRAVLSNHEQRIADLEDEMRELRKVAA